MVYGLGLRVKGRIRVRVRDNTHLHGLGKANLGGQQCLFNLMQETWVRG
jgi:hypothetical protein